MQRRWAAALASAPAAADALARAGGPSRWHQMVLRSLVGPLRAAPWGVSEVWISDPVCVPQVCQLQNGPIARHAGPPHVRRCGWAHAIDDEHEHLSSGVVQSRKMLWTDKQRHTSKDTLPCTSRAQWHGIQTGGSMAREGRSRTQGRAGYQGEARGEERGREGVKRSSRCREMRARGDDAQCGARRINDLFELFDDDGSGTIEPEDRHTPQRGGSSAVCLASQDGRVSSLRASAHGAGVG